jgi:predicted GNAT family N-acyltransferase
MPITIKHPETDTEFAQYYNLRWRSLRAPWHQPQGSEKDELEASSHHVIACNDDDSVIGVGRLQFNTDKQAQIRYMAVEPAHEGHGIGRQIVLALEAIARRHNCERIMLDAREPAVGFYEKLGYEIKTKSYLLFDSIQHYRMQKTL